MQTTAAVLRSGSGPYALETVELRALHEDEVLVRIVGAGMCHTDVLPRIPDMAGLLPIITGHEGSGVVEAVGSGVRDIVVGDHVVLSFDSCGVCANCRDGRPTYCAEFMVRNLTGMELAGPATAADVEGQPVNGRWFGQSSFAHHVISRQRNTVVVDKSLPLEQMGPLGCGIQTGAGSIAVAMNVQPDRSLVVYGAGAVGLAAIMAAKIVGASPIIAVDLHDHRLALAQELGATHIINGGHDDVLEQVMAASGGGVDYAFDTTGVPSVMSGALMATKLGGTVGYVGVQQGPMEIGPSDMVGKTILGILEGSVDPQEFVPRMIEWWQAGQFPFDRLIETYPMEQINEAEQDSLEGKTIKPVLLP